MEETKKGGGPLAFFKEVKTELTKVIWPTRAETIRLTVIVITISIAVGLYVGGLDFVFTKGMELVLRK